MVMKSIVGKSLILSLVGTVSLLPSMTRAEDCFAGEKEILLEVVLDEDSAAEQGWTLECDGVELWNKPFGHLETCGLGYGDFTHDEACVSEDVKQCHFTFKDSYGDGMYSPGAYYLTFGATTVMVYNDEEPFYEQATCFGSECSTPPQEVVEDYDDVYFFLRLDSKPEETSYKIECEGGVVLAEGGPYNSTQEYVEIEIETIVEPYSCCHVTVMDTGNDGLTSPHVNATGYSIYLDWAGHKVIGYPAQSGVEFTTTSVEFGAGC